MRRQQEMRLDERYVPYLQMAGLYHLVRLNDRWFRLDEPLVSAFVERWRPETHTFHMPFGECTITLQDVAYQLGLPVDGRYVSGCLTDFYVYIEGGRPAWGADEETVRRFARAYIMMLLGTQLFADKSSNRIHIRWLPFVARLEEMGGYSWGSAELAWLYRCMCRVANRHVVKWSGYNHGISEKGPRVQMARLRIDLLQARDFIWMPYSTPDVLQVVHPEVLEPRHTMLWRCVTSLIYFAVVEWHQVDRVLPQFGGVQPPPHPTLNIDFLMSKDGRGDWETRADHVLRFDVVDDSGPSQEFLAWWHQHGKRFLSPEVYLGDPRGIPIPVEATQRGAG
ncbi:hypothetical protein Ahy_B01g057106 isoform D [Arachis hypogaea]|uniref:Aminotransferase-like plant mobile domain-containing protein n=1 Tax=Arachis hypogaea TaxID=3818 RepID=A0A445B093_ARAHY|nr:hypothetical protein Ahy_B01g057106 isoform D [Arachis hypogaea]